MLALPRITTQAAGLLGLAYRDLLAPSIQSETIAPKLTLDWGPYPISYKMPVFDVKTAVGVLEQSFESPCVVVLYGALQNQELMEKYSSITYVLPTSAPVSTSELIAELFGDSMADTGTS